MIGVHVCHVAEAMKVDDVDVNAMLISIFDAKTNEDVQFGPVIRNQEKNVLWYSDMADATCGNVSDTSDMTAEIQECIWNMIMYGDLHVLTKGCIKKELAWRWSVSVLEEYNTCIQATIRRVVLYKKQLARDVCVNRPYITISERKRNKRRLLKEANDVQIESDDNKRQDSKQRSKRCKKSIHKKKKRGKA